MVYDQLVPLIQQQVLQKDQVERSQEEELVEALEEAYQSYTLNQELDSAYNVVILIFNVAKHFDSTEKMLGRLFEPSSVYHAEELQQLLEEEMNEVNQNTYLKLFYKAEFEGTAEEVCEWAAKTILQKFYFRLEDFTRFSMQYSALEPS